jgi:hypothetical protein
MWLGPPYLGRGQGTKKNECAGGGKSFLLRGPALPARWRPTIYMATASWTSILHFPQCRDKSDTLPTQA